MDKNIRSKIICWVGLYVLALTVRFLALLVLGMTNPPVSDEAEYFEPAASLANGKGYAMIPQQSDDGIERLTAYRMPGPAMLLSLSFIGFGVKSSVARITCICISSFSAPLLFSFTRRFASWGTAMLAGVGCVFYPSWIYYSQAILSETFFIPALLFALCLTTDSVKPGNRSAFFAGLVWGLATLMRPHALPISVIAALFIGLKFGKRPAILMVLGVSIALAPWFIRNLMVFGRPILLATESGETFLGSNNPSVYRDPAQRGMWLSPLVVPEYRDHLKPIRDEVERSREQTKMGLAFLRQNPEAVPILAFYKLTRWLTPVTVSRGLIRACVLASYGSMLIILLYGVIIGVVKPSTPLYLVIICSVIFSGITAVYWGGLVRGRLPLEIVWLPWAALAVAHALGLAARAIDGRAEGAAPQPTT